MLVWLVLKCQVVLVDTYFVNTPVRLDGTDDMPLLSSTELNRFYGMGGPPRVELYIVYRKVYEIATRLGLIVVRNLIGPYITSLEMAGPSITMLKMNDQLPG